MILATIGKLAGRFWPYVLAGALCLAAFAGFKILQAKLDAAQAQRDKAITQLTVSNESIGRLQADIDKQNQAIAELDADGARRLEEGRALILEEVRRGTRASEAARGLLSQPKTGGDQSRTSETIMNARELL